MKETVSDNPAQVERLKEVEIIAGRWKTEAAEPFISIKDEIITGDALRDKIHTMIVNGDGKTRMDALRVAVGNSVGIETGLKGFWLLRTKPF